MKCLPVAETRFGLALFVFASGALWRIIEPFK
jgi:hypothetical protein